MKAYGKINHDIELNHAALVILSFIVVHQEVTLNVKKSHKDKKSTVGFYFTVSCPDASSA